MDKKWYVIHTYSGHENKVKTNLEKAIHAAGLEEHFGQILVATEDFAEMQDGKRKISKRKTFPSYVMVEMDLDNETRHLVQNVPGRDAVHRLRARRRSPSRRTRCGGSWARWRATKPKPVPTVTFRVGEHVEVVDGPFSDFTGVVDEVNNERGKVKVMVQHLRPRDAGRAGFPPGAAGLEAPRSGRSGAGMARTRCNRFRPW